MKTRTWKALLLFASIHLLIGWVAKSHPVKEKEGQRQMEVKSLPDPTPAFSSQRL